MPPWKLAGIPLDRDSTNAQCINDAGTRKKCYFSGKEARRAAKKLGHRSYQCGICKLWHTSKKPRTFAPLKNLSVEDLTET